MRVIDLITSLLLESRLFDDPEKVRQPTQKAKKKKNKTHMGLKIGQGGTLDPLADGVLGNLTLYSIHQTWLSMGVVIGVNRGTKHLNRFLECSKASFVIEDSDIWMTRGPSAGVRKYRSPRSRYDHNGFRRCYTDDSRFRAHHQGGRREGVGLFPWGDNAGSANVNYLAHLLHRKCADNP